MERRLGGIPWFLAAPGVALATFAVAVFGYVFVGDLFVQTCANDVNLLTGEVSSSCADSSSPTGGESTADDGALLLDGTFQDGEPGHRGSGTAEVQRLADGSLNLHLADFSVTSGPDLFVYLSKSADGGPGEFLNLGPLKANNGSLNLAIPAGTEVAEYRRVLIWCKQFAVNFAFARLEKREMEPVSSGASPVSATAVPPAGGTAASSSPAAGQAGPGVVATGQFRNGAPGHQGSGTAEIQRLADGSLNVRLANFSVTSGPDLIVYLSPSPDDYVTGGTSLGSLKANNGNQNYAIPAGVNLDGVRSVVIWCKSFPTVFAFATLELN